MPWGQGAWLPGTDTRVDSLEWAAGWAAFADWAWPQAIGGARRLQVTTGGFSFQITNTLAFPSILEKLFFKLKGVTRGRHWAHFVDQWWPRPVSHFSMHRCPCLSSACRVFHPLGPPLSLESSTPAPTAGPSGPVAGRPAFSRHTWCPGLPAAGAPLAVCPPAALAACSRTVTASRPAVAHASLLGCRPSTIGGPDERLAPARRPAVARGFRAGSPDGSVGRTCRQPAAPRSARGDPVLLKPREPATQGRRGRLCWLVPHSCGR